MTKRIKIKDSIPKSKWQILTHGLNNSVSNIQSNLVVNDVRRARLDELSKFEYNWGGGRDTGDIHRALVKRCEELGK